MTISKKPAIERAARAICSSDGHPENIQFEGKPMWQSYLPQARAVLNAIRDPTDRMIDAGQFHAEEADENRCRLGWQAMIDAALQESPQ